MLIEEAIQRGEQWAIERFFSPRELRELEYWGIFSEGDPRLLSYRDRRKTLIGIGGVLTEAEEPNGQPLIDGIDPLALSSESPLYDLSTFQPIRRLFSIGKLGLSREAPFINIPSRGQHAFQVGVEGLKFAARNGWSKQDKLLAFIAGLTHDPHPGFGDAAKITFQIREEDVMKEYFSDTYILWWNSWLKLMEDHFDVASNYQNVKGFIERVITRQDRSLPGVITHGTTKNCLDLDFWTYTIEDARAATQLVRMPDKRYDTEADALARIARLSFGDRIAQLHAGLLDFDSQNDLGRLKESVWIDFQEVDIRPYLQIVNGEFVSTQPAIFHNLVRLAAVLYESYYFHPNVLGPEFMFAKEINANLARYPSVEEFTTLTDSQLAEILKGTPAGEWLKGENHHGWRISADEFYYPRQHELAVEATYPSVNLRLSTPVIGVNGKIGRWKDLFPQEAEPLVSLEQKSGRRMKLIKFE